MNYHTLTRHNSHNLSNQTLSENPSQIAAILFGVLPLLFAIIAHVSLFRQNIRIIHNFFVRSYPPTSFVGAATVIGLVADAVISVYVILNQAWTVKSWILFTSVLVLVGLAVIIFVADTRATLVITLFIVALAAVFNEWLFIETKNMTELDSASTNWKHIVRNLIGGNEAILLIWVLELIGQTLVHIFKISDHWQVIVFWVSSAIVLIGVFVWNILSFGPVVDLIGYVILAVFLLVGAFQKIIFFKSEKGGDNSSPIK